ncbi:MAG TPA: 4-hydroxy-tetrahydrodipicolinate synthase [Polyangiales bacterium]|nr:4-hydroxy-tetrahydrodipicolinate synthase [Polyangiales bacterium]
MFEGIYTALITPFRDGEVDYPTLAKLIERQVDAGVDGVVPCGSTGESATLSHDEHERVIAFTVEKANKRLKVIAGTGSNSTRETIRLTKAAADHGADGALLIAPYYNKPTQDGLYAHFAAVAEGVALPQIVYNIPGRTAVNIAPETFGKLAKLENVVGAKESSGSIDQISHVIELCGPDFTVLSGDDSFTVPVLAIGGRGVISVISNVLPKPFRELVRAGLAGDFATARQLHYELLPVLRALFLETNPIGIKAALALTGLGSEELRLPLTRITDPTRAALKKALEAAGAL